MDIRPIAQGIITYILANEPQTFSQIQAKAQGKPWYSVNTFYDVMAQVGKGPRISATVHGDDIVYKRKRVISRTARPMYRIPCPPLTSDNDAHHKIFDAMCFCFQFCEQGKAEALHDRKVNKVHGERCYLYERNADTK